MRILFLGFSKFIQGRLLAYIEPGDVFSEVAVASKSAKSESYGKFPCISKIYTDYQEAIENFSPDIVYIALINSLHTEWIEKSLNHRCHVIVDKPACLSLEETEAMLALADKNHCCLAEALVYEAHTQITCLEDQFLKADIKPQSIVTTFAFPPFADDNFRNKKNLGGGAVWDLGPYAVSLGRIIFKAPVVNISAMLSSSHPQTGVDTGFSLLARFSEGRSLVGHFSFNAEYRNSALVLGPGMNVEINRIFTTPWDLSNTLQVQHAGSNRNQDAIACNAPVEFLRNIVSAIKSNNWEIYSKNLLNDAKALDSLNNALEA
jgi:NDP-hexose-3-ketoreductase